jgi:hypothetical protein
MAWIQIIARRDADAALAATYERMAARPMPSVYKPSHGDAPGIIRAHSLDPELMPLVFGGMSASLAAGDTLTWAERELVNASTSRLNQCLY